MSAESDVKNCTFSQTHYKEVKSVFCSQVCIYCSILVEGEISQQSADQLLWFRINPVEFDGIRMQAGLNSFTLTPNQWAGKTGAIRIISKAGDHGGTYAHKNIAFEFASWISVKFKLYLIKEFQRLKEDKNRRLSLAWNLNRTLSRLNYHIHMGMEQGERLKRLNKIAIRQMQTLTACLDTTHLPTGKEEQQ